MSRSRPAPIDYARDLVQWRGLLAQVHEAVERQPAASESLALSALRARDMWNPPAAYPASLISGAFLGLVVAFVRQPDPDARRRVGAVAIEVAALVDQLVEATGVTAVLAETSRPEGVGRLPYADT